MRPQTRFNVENLLRNQLGYELGYLTRDRLDHQFWNLFSRQLRGNLHRQLYIELSGLSKIK